MQKDNLDPNGQSRPKFKLRSLFDFLRDNRGFADPVPSDPSPSDPAPSDPAPSDPAPQPADWKATLDPAIKDHPSLSTFKDPGALAKSWVEAQKLIGMEKIPVPKEDSPKDVWDTVYTRLGRPVDAAGYKLPEIADRPEQLPVNEAEAQAFKTKAHELGLNQKQVAGLYEWFVGSQIEQFNNVSTKSTEKVQQAETSLRKQWGSAYDQNIDFAKKVMRQFADKDAQDLINNEFGSNPAVIKLFAEIGKKFSEDGIQIGGSTGYTLTPDQAQDEINKIKGDKENPYHKKGHPEHAAAVKKMDDLYKMAYGTKPVT